MSSERLPTRFIDLNADILLDVVYHLVVEDLIALLGTCYALRSLQKIKLFWLYALDATQRVRPLPLPHNTKLADLDTAELRKAAFYAQRLALNWNRKHPTPYGPIQSLTFNQDAQIVSLIPGANIVVIFATPNLVCFESGIEELSAPLHVGERCWRISRAYFEKAGQFLVTVASGDDPRTPTELKLIEITYTPGACPKLKVRESTGLTPTFFDAFVFDDVIGYLWLGDAGMYHVTAWNFNTKEEVNFRTCFRASGSSILACYLDYGHLFLVREDETGIDAVRYHRSMLPYGTGPAPVHGKPIYSSSRLPIAPFASIGLSPGFSNSYGIVAVSARAAPDAIQRPYAMFYTMHTTPDDIGAELRQAPPAQLAAPVQCVEGTGEALTSVRPTCAVYVLESEPFARHTRLQIVRYLGKDDVDTEHIVVLDQEDTGIESGDITSITSDDYMGVIYLTTVDGTLFVIRFA